MVWSRLNIRVKLAIIAAALLVVAFLALRFGGELLGPLLDTKAAAPDSQSVAAVNAPDSTSTIAQAGDTSGMIRRYGPFVIDGRAYTFQVQRDTGGDKPPEAARRVQAFDPTGRIVYDENLYLRRDSTSSTDWMELSVHLLEDASGIARGFELEYMWFPSAPSSGVAFTIIAPRGDSLAVLTPTEVGYYGEAVTLPSGAAPGSWRFEPGNRTRIESGRGWFNAMINLRVDMGCSPRAADCVRIDLPDSIAGLARFPVKPTARQKVDSLTSIDLYPAPHASSSEKIAIPPGQDAEILGGAGKVYFDHTPGLYLSADDEWLEIRLNGKRGWITGPAAFEAIGLRQVG